MTTEPDPLAELSALEARLADAAERLASTTRALDGAGREDTAAEVAEIERLVETAVRRTRRILRRR